MAVSEPTAMGKMLADIALVIKEVFQDIGVVCTTITDEPLLLLTVGFLFLGGCVGIFGRLLSRN